MNTLRQVCEETSVTRRAVQGYEKAGLVAPTGKNVSGHLLYNDEVKERIRRIKMFQEIGYTIKEIIILIDAPKSQLKTALKKKQLELQADITRTKELIYEIQNMIDECDR